MASTDSGGTVPVGHGIGAIVVGMIVLTFGIAYLANYKGIADYTHKKHIGAWQSTPVWRRRMAPGAEQTTVRTVRLFRGVTLTAFGALAVVLGVLSLMLR